MSKSFSEILYDTIFKIINSSLNSENDADITRDDAKMIIKEARSIFEKESCVLNLNGKFIIVGDIHGDIQTLIRIFGKYGYPPKTSYIFLGDYVDRGQRSCEVILMLFSLKILYSDNIYLLRGNHEFDSMNCAFGFKDECLKKFNNEIYDSFEKTFDQLPIIAIINKSIFCVHGGISHKILSLNDISNLKKPKGNQTDDVITDFLWSDPSYIVSMYDESPRNAGKIFGDEALKKFLNSTGLKYVIRSHECIFDGYDYPLGQNNKIITIFSSCNYCGSENDAAVIKLCNKGITVSKLTPLTRESINKFRPIYPEELINLNFNIPILA